MTRDEWLRELDALAEEHVMGLRWVTCTAPAGIFSEGRSYLRTPQEAESLIAHGGLEMGKADRPVMGWLTPYTTDISDAWKLVEATTEDVAVLMLDGPDPWTAAFDPGSEPFGRGRADSAPLAITLAALRAHGVEIPEEPADG